MLSKIQLKLFNNPNSFQFTQESYDSLIAVSTETLLDEWRLDDSCYQYVETFVEECAQFGNDFNLKTNSQIYSHFDSTGMYSVTFLDALNTFNDAIDSCTTYNGVQNVKSSLDTYIGTLSISTTEKDILYAVTSTAESSYKYWLDNNSIWSNNDIEIRDCPNCKKIAKADANGIVQGMVSGGLIGLIGGPVGAAVGLMSGGIGGGAVGSAAQALGWVW